MTRSERRPRPRRFDAAVDAAHSALTGLRRRSGRAPRPQPRAAGSQPTAERTGSGKGS